MLLDKWDHTRLRVIQMFFYFLISYFFWLY